MHFLDVIFSIVWDISDWFYRGYLRTDGWVWPFYRLAEVFLYVSDLFWGLLTPIAHFYDWVVDVSDRTEQIFDIDNVKALLRYWLDRAEWSWQWIQDAWYYVTGWIDDWWLLTQDTVEGWITAATEGFNELAVAWDNFWTITWPELVTFVNSLSAAWDDFWVNIFPTLVSFSWLTTWWNARVLDVQDLIDSAFTLRESWWAGWQEIKEQVLEFFSDPLEWLWSRFTDWFLGPEA